MIHTPFASSSDTGQHDVARWITAEFLHRLLSLWQRRFSINPMECHSLIIESYCYEIQHFGPVAKDYATQGSEMVWNERR
jgi:hypothetical protein